MPQEAKQLDLEFLESTFDIQPARKTLKTKVLKNTKLEEAVLKAYCFVLDNKQGYTAMEFAYGRCYIVVAKLKERGKGI